MIDWFSLIISFIVGGGFTTVLNFRYLRRNQKIDFADKMIKFMEEQNTKLLLSIRGLENDIKELKSVVCYREKCDNRQTQ